MKVVINKCFGGYGLNMKAQKEIGKLKGKPLWFYTGAGCSRETLNRVDCDSDAFILIAVTKDFGEKTTWDEIDDFVFDAKRLERNDKDLIQALENLGVKNCNTRFSSLKIVKLPKDVTEYEITDYDGVETLHEKHRSW